LFKLQFNYEDVALNFNLYLYQKLSELLIDKKMIKTFKVPGTSLALSPDSILFTADNSSLYAHDIVTGELHGSVKHRNLTPQGDGESAKVLCCSRDKLIVAKGPCVFYLSIDPNKFFVFLTGNPK